MSVAMHTPGCPCCGATYACFCVDPMPSTVSVTVDLMEFNPAAASTPCDDCGLIVPPSGNLTLGMVDSVSDPFLLEIGRAYTFNDEACVYVLQFAPLNCSFNLGCWMVSVVRAEPNYFVQLELLVIDSSSPSNIRFTGGGWKSGVFSKASGCRGSKVVDWLGAEHSLLDWRCDIDTTIANTPYTVNI